MVGNRNHPLNESHYDENLLYDYVLGHLPPDEENRVRQHLMMCPSCRAVAADIRAFCKQLVRGLHEELDSAQPGPQLNFDRIAAQRRRRLLSRLQPSALAALLVLSVTLLILEALHGFWTADRVASLQGPKWIDPYAGPAAVVAATTDDGLVVMRLSPAQTGVVAYVNDVASPRDLQISPDGQWLVFRQANTLFVRAVGYNATFHFPVRDSAGWAWSPDSQSLAYTDGTGQLIIFDPAAHTSRLLVPAEDAAWGTPVWDEDSRHISYTVLKPINARTAPYLLQGIWHVAVDTGYRAELVRNPVPSDTLLIANETVQWSESRPLLPDPALPQEPLPENAQRSQLLAWSPDRAWVATIVSAPAQAQGVYLFSFNTASQRRVDLPGGATNRAAFWGDSSHLFVIRQRWGSATCELWMVPLAADEAPQRLLSGIDLPPDSDWRDVLSVQLLTP